MASKERTAFARGGFTLLELLVVMMIVVVAIAFLYPVVSSVREKGRQALCLTHVSQHARAVLMYSQDYDERLPIAWNRTLAGKPDDETIYPHWWNVLQPYVPSKGVFECPDDTGYLGAKPGDPNNNEPFYPDFGSSYHSLVGWLPLTDPTSLPLPRQPGGLGGVPLSSLADPSNTVLSYDSWPNWHSLIEGDEDADMPHVNASYADGSARKSRARYIATYLAQGPPSTDGSSNGPLGDLPQLDTGAPVTTSGETGTVRTAADSSPAGTSQNESKKQPRRLAKNPRNRKRPFPPKSRNSDDELRTASENKPTKQDSPKPSPFGGN